MRIRQTKAKKKNSKKKNSEEVSRRRREPAKASKKGAPFVTARTACQVRQAESTITASPPANQVRLTVRYQTYSHRRPVTVGLKLRDRKGAVALEHATRHLERQGRPPPDHERSAPRR